MNSDSELNDVLLKNLRDNLVDCNITILEIEQDHNGMLSIYFQLGDIGDVYHLYHIVKDNEINIKLDRIVRKKKEKIFLVNDPVKR